LDWVLKKYVKKGLYFFLEVNDHHLLLCWHLKNSQPCNPSRLQLQMNTFRSKFRIKRQSSRRRKIDKAEVPSVKPEAGFAAN